MNLPRFKELLLRHHLKYPVQMVPIAHDLNLKVYKAQGFPDNISGRVYRSDKDGGTSGYAIDVNANHPEKRRRFTIAHEIAHYVLHRGLIGEELADDSLYRSGLSNAIEAQANRLAADILMPFGLIDSAKSRGIHSVADLAQAFNVLEAAMGIRLGVSF